ncbi:low molecular weight phosphotyrosine protein phosphatase [Kiloniella laminariae]|uniref:protein-tyrosine-phosphatase n=1 Tax=Kiloniella laminariae TaxID=454162 RepID=A0ABT4LIW8_9PROT|nr:low molecular weight protein-tyrosine-phosphatase [Kiloniella laminariae]MCZ4281038.1 low molecular weight phosphotyrosine protein phosphatase [Kiloniella laminariae]
MTCKEIFSLQNEMNMMMKNYSVLFVCTGNICRSPAGEGILRHRLREKNMDKQVRTDSAGTHDYHLGDPPTATGLKLARKRGYDYADLRARKVTVRDFEEFDLVLAMDMGHLAILQQICPAERYHKLSLFLDYSAITDKNVADPYYGGAADYEAMLDVIEQGVDALLPHIEKQIHD